MTPTRRSRRGDHKVVVYDDDRQYVRMVGDSAFAALAGGKSVVIVGTSSQLAAAEEWIELSRAEAARDAAFGRFTTMDAEEVVDRIIAATEPAHAFEAVLLDACAQGDLPLATATMHVVGSLVIFGSLVGALWERSKLEVAASIEKLGNRLADERGTSVLCALPAVTVATKERRKFLASYHSAVAEARAEALAPLYASTRRGGGATSSATGVRMFPGAAPACRAARRFVREILESNQSNDEVIDAIELICSELSANAIRHAHTVFTVALECSPARVRIAVTDEMPPAPGEGDGFPVRTGHGLGIVAALAKDWGVDLDERGHAVWAEVAGRRGGSEGADWWVQGSAP